MFDICLIYVCTCLYINSKSFLLPLQESLPDVQMEMDKVPNATFDEEPKTSEGCEETAAVFLVSKMDEKGSDGSD